MQYITLASLFAAALAAPAAQTPDCPNPAHCGPPSDPSKYENLQIMDFFLRKNNDGLRSINFKLTGDNVTNVPCSLDLATQPDAVTTCGDGADTNYRFGVNKPFDASSSTANLTFYHQTSTAWGKWGAGSIPTYCHAGGDGVDDLACSQIGQVTVSITSS